MKPASIGALVGLVLSFATAAPASALDCAGQPGGARLVVEVTGLRSAAGEVAVTLYPDDRARFLAKGGKLLRQRVAARKPVTAACFWLPRAGSYAVAVYHDADGDHDFDRSFIGLPAEGYGFSNDPAARAGLPSLESVRFRAASPETRIRIRLRYPR